MQGRARLFFALPVMMGLAAPCAPAAAQAEDTIAYARSLQQLQQTDQRVQSIGWKLAKDNARFCGDTRLSIGLLMQDVMGYNRPDAARAALAVPTDFAVQAVATGSPADRSGLIHNQPIVAIDGQNLSETVRNAKAAYLRLLWAERTLQDSLNTRGFAALSVPDRTEPITITGEKICALRIVVRPGDEGAAADAKALYIGGKFPGLAYSDDELAAAIAHEMAHVVLRHPQWLSDNGRKRRDVRATERDADRMMPWLLANAGYDPAASMRFMRKWGPKHSGGLFRKRTHDGWDERVEFMKAELPLIQAALTRDGFADWSKRFPRKPVD